MMQTEADRSIEQSNLAAAFRVASWGTEFVRNTAISTIAASVLLNPSDSLCDSARAVTFDSVSAITVSVAKWPPPAFEQVKLDTQAIFSDAFTWTEEQDPEIDADRYFVFRVRDSGDVEDILRRNDEWHARLSLTPMNLRGLFRLSIDAR